MILTLIGLLCIESNLGIYFMQLSCVCMPVHTYACIGFCPVKNYGISVSNLVRLSHKAVLC